MGDQDQDFNTTINADPRRGDYTAIQGASAPYVDKPEPPKTSSSNAQKYFKWVTGASFVFQTTWAVLALIYLLTDRVGATPAKTPQSDLNPFGLVLAFGIAQGLAWAVLVGMWIFWSRALDGMSSAIGKFLSYYTLFYVLIIAWYSYWVNISGKSNAIAPKPGTIGFISYAGLQLSIVIGTVFFDSYVWDVWNAGGVNVDVAATNIAQLPSENYGAFVALQVFAVLLSGTGFAMGLVGYLRVLQYNMASPWVILGIYIGYGGLYIGALITYAVILYRKYRLNVNKLIGSTKDLFDKHWRQVDSAVIFFSFVFWVNFGFAVQLWSKLSSGQAHSGVYFPNSPPYFWVITFMGIFNAIFMPMFVYYFVTVLCMVPWMMAKANKSPFEKSEKVSFLAVTLGTPFFAFMGIRKVTIKTDQGERFYDIGAPGAVLTGILKFILWIGAFFQLIFAFFIFYDLLHTQYTYLSQVFRPWYISVLVIQIFMWAVYFLYAMITIGRSSTIVEYDKSVKDPLDLQFGNPFKHSVMYCQYIRPTVTFLIVVFLETFAMSEIYKKLENGHGIILRTNIADPTNEAYLVYNATFIIMLGLIYAAILCFTDMMASLYSIQGIIALKERQKVILETTEETNMSDSVIPYKEALNNDLSTVGARQRLSSVEI